MRHSTTSTVGILLAGRMALMPASSAHALPEIPSADYLIETEHQPEDGVLEDPAGELSDEPLVPADSVETESSGNDGYAGIVPATAQAVRRPAPIACDITQDRPHISHKAKKGYTVNTHLRGRCPTSVVHNTVTGSTYRSAWYGWVHQKSGTGSGKRTYKKLNLAFGCHKNKTFNYRTMGRYYSTFSNGYRGISYRTTSATGLKCTYR